MAKRTDANQREIVEAFRKLGATVFIVSEVGRGLPDLIVGIYGINLLFEVKDGKKPPSAQKLTEREKWFFEMWKGQVHIVTSVQEVYDIVKTLALFPRPCYELGVVSKEGELNG